MRVAAFSCVLVLAAGSLAGCSSPETFINAHSGVTGQLTLTRLGLTHELDGMPTVTFDAGNDRISAILRMSVRFEDTALAFFFINVTGVLRVRDTPTLSAPFTYEAEYPANAQGLRAKLPLTGSLRAGDLYLVCDGDEGPCGLGTRDGRLEVSTTSSISEIRVAGALEFTTDPRVEELP